MVTLNCCPRHREIQNSHSSERTEHLLFPATEINVPSKGLPGIVTDKQM